MSKFLQWSYIISILLMFICGVLSYMAYENVQAILFFGIIMWQVYSLVIEQRMADTQRKIKEVRGDLELALNREREFMYRALAAETALAYEKYDNKPGENVGRFEGDAE